MAQLRTAKMDYEGMGDRVFNREQRVMESLRDSLNTVEYDPTKQDPRNQGAVFGDHATYYSNGNRISECVDQASLVQSQGVDRTGTLGPSAFDLHSGDATYRNIPLTQPVNSRQAYNNTPRGEAPVAGHTANYAPNGLLKVRDSRTKAQNSF